MSIIAQGYPFENPTRQELDWAIKNLRDIESMLQGLNAKVAGMQQAELTALDNKANAVTTTITGTGTAQCTITPSDGQIRALTLNTKATVTDRTTLNILNTILFMRYDNHEPAQTYRIVTGASGYTGTFDYTSKKFTAKYIRLKVTSAMITNVGVSSNNTPYALVTATGIPSIPPFTSDNLTGAMCSDDHYTMVTSGVTNADGLLKHLTAGTVFYFYNTGEGIFDTVEHAAAHLNGVEILVPLAETIEFDSTVPVINLNQTTSAVRADNCTISMTYNVDTKAYIDSLITGGNQG